MRADLVLFDYDAMCRPYVDPCHDPIETLLYRGSGQYVHTVIVNGRIVVEDGRVLTVDEKTIGSRLSEAASRPRTDKEKAFVEAMDQLKQHLIQYYRGWIKERSLNPFYFVNSRIEE
jgi:hypothetical protein